MQRNNIPDQTDATGENRIRGRNTGRVVNSTCAAWILVGLQKNISDYVKQQTWTKVDLNLLCLPGDQ